MEKITIPEEEVERIFNILSKTTPKTGYYLNPDKEFTKGLIKSLLVNGKRYGYWACPCRLASGNAKKDADIVCPCPYRVPDVKEFGCCYCALYVSKDVADGKKQAKSIPERRKFN